MTFWLGVIRFAYSTWYRSFWWMLGGSVVGLNEEHAISVQFFYISSLRDQTEIWCSSIKYKHYLQACTTSGKELLICMQRNQWKRPSQ